jgi:outer membrane protein assembly factor BamD
LESAYYFRSFFDIYTRSEKAEEALFMHAFSLYKQSPVTSLDQTSSREAIDAFQGFLNRFPESDRAARADKLISEMQVKLEEKAYDNAKQYFNLRYHEAAVISLENFRKDYPDSKMNQEAAFLRIKSQYEFAKKSFLVKQPERYKTVIKFYEDYVDRYPESPNIREAENIFRAARKELQEARKMVSEYEKTKEAEDRRRKETAPEELDVINN